MEKNSRENLTAEPIKKKNTCEQLTTESENKNNDRELLTAVSERKENVHEQITAKSERKEKACQQISTLKLKAVLLLCLFGIMILNNGINAVGFTYFFVDFIDELKSTSALVGLCHSLSFGIVAVVGPLIYKLVALFGYVRTLLTGCVLSSVGLIFSSLASDFWHIFLAHTVLTGLGTSIISVALTCVITQNFKDSASLYLGFMYAGTATGFIIMPVVCSKLRPFYGWRGTLLLLSAIELNSLALTFIFFSKLSRFTHRRKKKRISMNESFENLQIAERLSSDEIDEDSEEVQNQSTNLSTLRLFLKYPKLFSMAVQVFVWYLAYIGFFVHFIAGVMSKGYNEDVAANLFAIYGCGNLLSRLGTYIPVRFRLINEINLYTLSLAAAGACMLAVALLQSLSVLFIVLFILGMSLGSIVTLHPVVTREFVPRERFNEVWGIIMIPKGMSCIVNGYIMGAIYDVTGSYSGAFFLASGCMFSMSLLMAFPKLVQLFSNK